MNEFEEVKFTFAFLLVIKETNFWNTLPKQVQNTLRPNIIKACTEIKHIMDKIIKKVQKEDIIIV
ncbi:hypothetical protein [Methanococcus maripaludis]|uniref:hypothetical protein n=1 Tax=Methanococcus maripaludis TaxID=39152 RepID=UPI0006905081|nr:hypothetical protein [Methanococcus maripaludis]